MRLECRIPNIGKHNKATKQQQQHEIITTQIITTQIITTQIITTYY